MGWPFLRQAPGLEPVCQASSSLQRVSDHRQGGRVVLRGDSQAPLGDCSLDPQCPEAAQDRASFVFLDAAGSI